MTRKKLFWVLMIPIVASVYFVQHAYAAGEEFRWNGSDKIIANGGAFSKGAEFQAQHGAVSGSNVEMTRSTATGCFI